MGDSAPPGAETQQPMDAVEAHDATSAMNRGQVSLGAAEKDVNMEDQPTSYKAVLTGSRSEEQDQPKEHQRGRFVKIAVEVDLTKPLKGTILFKGKAQKVIYEGIPTICFTCGKTDHSMALCPLTASSSKTGETSTARPTVTGPRNPADRNDNHSSASPGVGEWMTAPVRPRKQMHRRPDPQPATPAIVQDTTAGSRYAALSTDLDANGGLDEPTGRATEPWIPVSSKKHPNPKKPAKQPKPTPTKNQQHVIASNPPTQSGSIRKPLVEITNLNPNPLPSASRVHKSPLPNHSIQVTDAAPKSLTSCDPSQHVIPTAPQKQLPTISARDPQPGNTTPHSVILAASTPLDAILTSQEVEYAAELGNMVNHVQLSKQSPLQRTRHKPSPPDLNFFEDEASPSSSSPPRKDSKWGLVLKKGSHHPFKRLGKRGSSGPPHTETGSLVMDIDEVLSHDTREVGVRYKPSIMVIVEPRISGERATRVIRRLGFPRSHRVDSRGFSGGIWILWKNDLLSVQVLISHAQFIHMKISTEHSSFLFTAVYGSPRATMRKSLWANLEVLATVISVPWLLAGDFNATLNTAESSPSRRVPSYSSRAFQDCLINSDLMDLGFSGPNFTWRRGTLQKRLDRALGNSCWSTTFVHGQIYHLPYLHSDHRPLLIIPDASMDPTSHPPRFLFKASWITHEDYGSFVSRNWEGHLQWSQTLEKFSTKLLVWQKTVFGSTTTKKRQLLTRLQGIQVYLDKKPSRFLSNLELEFRCELDKILAQEELEWYQRSRCQWLKWGDRNTAYFHLSTQIRKRNSKIAALQDEDGTWVTNPESLKNLAMRFYQQLFTDDHPQQANMPLHSRFPQMGQHHLRALESPITGNS
ncbi:hypothetical protein Tsubulata_039886 [Turnera subulata]|uniref:Endonuclease/exonuclease/phosphatase domain-containing protein n=1 Tax=Turnera subulata TaxID=218843 RepID=A0A9Q0JD68_9ROSI|nr:hypothetical protein Tsubulata_039886 [Turnera subulata]